MSTTPTPRRRSRGRSWYWRQTGCWYFTPPGTRRRVRLLDENGRPIRGRQNGSVAELSLARVKANGNWRPTATSAENDQWQVAKVCSEFIKHCRQRAAVGSVTEEYRDDVARYLNSLCKYCGALCVVELQKGHIEHWIGTHPTWRSSATQRNAMTIVLAAFN